MDVDIEPDRDDPRLGRRFIAQQGLLVVGQPAVLVLGTAVRIPDIGVDEDEDARAQEHQEGDEGDDAGAALQPPREPFQPRQEPGLHAAPPEGVGQHQQDEGEGEPVNPEPGRPDPEPPLPVHVRQRNAGGRGVEVEVVREPQVRQHRRRDQVDHHQAPPEEFVGGQHLQDDRQRP